MNEEDARELAFAIVSGDFEELLAEHDIMIPSTDREGREEEACIYGTEYYLLEDAITDILVKGSRRIGKTPQTREMAFNIIEEFEEVLDYHHINVPSSDPARAMSKVALCLPEWDKLRDSITGMLVREKAKQAVTG